MRKPNTTCEICLTPVYRRPSDFKRFSHVYCSKRCQSKASEVHLVCGACKEEFVRTKREQKFCSASAVGTTYTGIRYAGTAIPNRSRAKLAKLGEWFDFDCCMVEGCNYSTTYDVHRFIPGKDGGWYERGNMYAICPNHHAEATRGLTTFERVDERTLRIGKPIG